VFKKILLGYDGSEPSKKAFDQCLEMARHFGAQLAIVTVVRPPEFAEDVETEAIIENARSHYDSELGKLRARANASGVQPVGLLICDTTISHPRLPRGRQTFPITCGRFRKA
jgi:nucleotide-binding universal stress UspA family protein